jgi:hypothetical protein
MKTLQGKGCLPDCCIGMVTSEQDVAARCCFLHALVLKSLFGHAQNRTVVLVSEIYVPSILALQNTGN